jgi:hypothetical protein
VNLRDFVFEIEIFKTKLKAQVVSLIIYVVFAAKRLFLILKYINKYKFTTTNINLKTTLLFTKRDVGNTQNDGGRTYTNLPALAPVWFSYFGR